MIINYIDVDQCKSFVKGFPAVNISENEKNYSLEVVALDFKKKISG